MTLSYKFLTVISVCSALSLAAEPAAPSPPMVFDGDSKALKATEVVATLDAPIPNGKNAIWCASFQAAWKALEKDLAQEPVSLEGSPAIAKALNQAPDPRSQIPEACLYVATGWNDRGVRNQIEQDLKQRFPGKPPPRFPRMAENSFVAYAYLEANVKFPIPYRQDDQPLTFKEGSGNGVDVNSFGIPAEAEVGLASRGQPEVLFWKGERAVLNPDLQFAIDLCAGSSPSQVVVARIPREATLAKALARVEREIRGMAKLERGMKGGRHLRLGGADSLSVPDFCWSVTHRFAQLESRAFRNPKLRGQSLDDAQQDIFFRLDKSGVELKSEAKMYTEGAGMWFSLDRPFLLYIKQRNASVPYFAMWIDNAELLSKWKKENRPRDAAPLHP